MLSTGLKAAIPVPNGFIPSDSQLVIDLSKHFSFPLATPTNTLVVNSSMGNFCIQLFPTNAPITVANFLNYVTNGYYSDLLVNQTLSNSFVQTGVYNIKVNSLNISDVSSFGAITNEFSTANLSNIRGTVAMANSGTNSNSATSQWFINVTNNGSKFDATNTNNAPPSAVFGEVIGNGMSIVDKIAALPTGNYGASFPALPLDHWSKTSYLQYGNLVVITNIAPAGSVICSDTNSFSAEIQGKNLVVTPLAPNLTPVTISVYAAGTNGNGDALSFQVSQEKLSQNITFNTIYAGYTNGGFSFPSYPTASSGLGVSLTIKSGPAYVSNGQLRFSGTGVVTLVATQSGNFFYYPAPPETGYIVVDKGSQTINFPTIPNQTNKTTPFNLTLTNFPSATSGLPVSVAVQSGPATLKGKTLSVTGYGTITLSGSQSGNSYYYPAPVTTTSLVVTNNVSTNTNGVTNSIVFGK